MKDLVSAVPDLHGDSDDQPSTSSTPASTVATLSSASASSAKPKLNDAKREVKAKMKEAQDPVIKRKR